MLETAETSLPQIALLGAQPYTTMLSNAGSGSSRYGQIAINRWRNDGTRDNHGQWCYLKDLKSGAVWSAGHQPVCAPAVTYRVEMTAGCVTFHRRDGSIETRTDISIVPSEPAEVRRITVSNSSDDVAGIELTSYQEIVLAPPVTDRGHRAFGNLFVQTEWLPENGSILAMRRPRSKQNNPTWAGHTIAVEASADSISCETDRGRFVGRGRTSRNPVAMDNPGDLSGTVGAVLDPVFALRTRLSIPPGESARVAFTTFVANDRDHAGELSAWYSHYVNADHVFDLAAVQADRELDELGIRSSEAALYQQLAGLLLYGVRPAGRLIIDERGQPPSTRADLLAIGITGEWPIVLASVATRQEMARVNELLTMHRYWRRKGLAADLVILCSAGDPQLRDDIVSIAVTADETDVRDRSQGVFIKPTDTLRQQDVALLDSIARIRVDCRTDSLSEIASA